MKINQHKAVKYRAVNNNSKYNVRFFEVVKTKREVEGQFVPFFVFYKGKMCFTLTAYLSTFSAGR